MNLTNQSPRPDDADQQLDLLVDGELSETQRRQLLRRLDGEPEGWRRCALAFLEAQCWKEALGPLGPEQLCAAPASADAGHEARSVSRRASPWLRRSGTLLAMAASFFVALLLGSWSRPLWRHESPGDFTTAQLTPITPSAQQGAPLGSLAGMRAGGPEKLPGTGAVSPWQMVTVSVPDEDRGGSEAIRLPAIERDHLDDAWLKSLPGPLPADVLQALRRTGHQVRQSRELVPVPMQDGRRLLVPVDQIELHYVGGAYQ